MKRFKIEKLVRDNPITSQGCNFKQRIITDEAEYMHCLKEKLSEEMLELKQANNCDDIAEEIADILELLHAFAQANKLTMQEIEEKRLEKCKTKGGYEKRIFGIWLECPEGSEPYKKMMAAPERYTQIPQD